MRTRAFTLVELLVVIGIIAVLIGILIPTLSKARKAAQTAQCLSNMRNFAIAHWMYAGENDGYIVRAGFGHGGAHGNEEVAWINTLQSYYKVKLLARCPSDNSPHWPGGTPLPGTTDEYRRTSYGINNYLDPEMCPPPNGPYRKINQVKRSSAVVLFLEMPDTGDFAGADHPHVENWSVPLMPRIAAEQMAVDRHGGPRAAWQSKANYAFLDGHAETLGLRDVFRNFASNKFDPSVAQ